jgi:ankyrin repeat protein
MNIIHQTKMSANQQLLCKIQEDLQPLIDWYMLGVYLKIPKETLDDIEGRHFRVGGIARCKLEMISFWLQNGQENEGLMTELVTALVKMNYQTLAEKISNRLEKEKVEEYDANPLESVVLLVERDTVKRFTELEVAFVNLEIEVIEQLVNSKVSPNTLKLFLSRRLDKDMQCLDTIEDVFYSIRNDYCCLNYTLLQEIVDNFIPNTGAQLKMSHYVQKNEDFANSTEMKDLVRSINASRHLTASDRILVTLKLAGFWPKVTLKRFRKLLELFFPEKTSLFSRLTVTDGCIQVSWYVPQREKMDLIRLATDKLNLVETLGILQIKIGNIAVVKRGEDSNAAYGICDALHEATCLDQIDGVKLLTDIGGDVNQVNNGGLLPLVAAVKEGHLSMVDYLIQLKADVNKSDDFGFTPLMMAVRCNNIKMTQVLITCKADVNKQSYGFTPLMLACDDNNIKLVKELIARGADINITGNDGKTALMFAVDNSNVEIVQVLIDEGANVNIQSSIGISAITMAILRKHHLLVDMLINKGDLYQYEGNGKTYLHIACSLNDPSMTALLLEKGFDPNITDSNGTTPLVTSCHPSSETDLATVAMLLAHEADPDYQDAFGNTALMLASMNTCHDVVEALLQAGANVHIRNIRGRTAIEFAALTRNETTARMLIDHGASKEEYETTLSKMGSTTVTLTENLNKLALVPQDYQDEGQYNYNTSSNTHYMPLSYQSKSADYQQEILQTLHNPINELINSVYNRY